MKPTLAERASRVVFAPRKDGKLRFCFEYKKLNAVKMSDSYPAPAMDERIDLLVDAAALTTLDCNRGYQ